MVIFSSVHCQNIIDYFFCNQNDVRYQKINSDVSWNLCNTYIVKLRRPQKMNEYKTHFCGIVFLHWLCDVPAGVVPVEIPWGRFPLRFAGAVDGLHLRLPRWQQCLGLTHCLEMNRSSKSSAWIHSNYKYKIV